MICEPVETGGFELCDGPEEEKIASFNLLDYARKEPGGGLYWPAGWETKAKEEDQEAHCSCASYDRAQEEKASTNQEELFDGGRSETVSDCTQEPLFSGSSGGPCDRCGLLPDNSLTFAFQADVYDDGRWSLHGSVVTVLAREYDPCQRHSYRSSGDVRRQCEHLVRSFRGHVEELLQCLSSGVVGSQGDPHGLQPECEGHIHSDPSAAGRVCTG